MQLEFVKYRLMIMGKFDVRKQELINLLAEKDSLSVNEVAAQYNISLPTARKMCSSLANTGAALRTHGGIQRMPAAQPRYSFMRLKHENIAEKIRIGRYAASTFKNGRTVFFEAGTTVLQCVIAFAERIKNNDLKDMIVFTNSLINLEILYPVCPVNLIGGLYRDERKDFTGYMSEHALKVLHFDHCVIGADAVSISGGVMAMDAETLRFDSELINHSENVLLLAHSGKLGRTSLHSITPLKNISCIVTDAGAGDDICRQCLESGINIVKV